MKAEAINKTDLRKAAARLAKQSRITTLQALSAMQTAAAQMGREDIIETLHEIKMEFIYS